MNNSINLIFLIAIFHYCYSIQHNFQDSSYVHSYEKFLTLYENNEIFNAIEMIPNMIMSEQVLAANKILEYIRENNKENSLIHLCDKYTDIIKELSTKEREILARAITSSMDLDVFDNQVNVSKKRPSSSEVTEIDLDSQIPPEKKRCLVGSDIITEIIDSDIISDDSEEAELLLTMIKNDDSEAIIKYLKTFTIDEYIYRLLFIFKHNKLFVSKGVDEYFRTYSKVQECLTRVKVNEIYNPINVIKYLINNNYPYILNILLERKYVSLGYMYVYFGFNKIDSICYGNQILYKDISSDLINVCNRRYKKIILTLLSYNFPLYFNMDNFSSNSFAFSPLNTQDNSFINSVLNSTLFGKAYKNKEHDLIIDMIKLYISLKKNRSVNPFEMALYLKDYELFESLCNNCWNFEDIETCFFNAIDANLYDIIDTLVNESISRNFVMTPKLSNKLLSILFFGERYNTIHRLLNYYLKNKNVWLKDAFVGNLTKCRNLRLIKYIINKLAPIRPLGVDQLICNSSLNIIDHFYKSNKINTDFKKKCLLSLSTEYNRLDIIKYLVDQDNSILDFAAESLEHACSNLKIDIVEFLLGKDPELVSKQKQNLFDLVLNKLIKNNSGYLDSWHTESKNILILSKFVKLFWLRDINIIKQSSVLKKYQSIGAIINNNWHSYLYIEIYCSLLNWYLGSDTNILKIKLNRNNYGMFKNSVEAIDSLGIFEGNKLNKYVISGLNNNADRSININGYFLQIIKYMMQGSISSNAIIKVKAALIELLYIFEPNRSLFRDNILNLIISGNVRNAFEIMKNNSEKYLLFYSIDHLKSKFKNRECFELYRNLNYYDKFLQFFEIFFEKDQLIMVFINALSIIYQSNAKIREDLFHTIGNFRDSKGNCILHHLYKVNDLNLIKFIISEYKDLIEVKNIDNQTPIEVITYNKPYIIQELLRYL